MVNPALAVVEPPLVVTTTLAVVVPAAAGASVHVICVNTPALTVSALAHTAGATLIVLATGP